MDNKSLNRLLSTEKNNNEFKLIMEALRQDKSHSLRIARLKLNDNENMVRTFTNALKNTKNLTSIGFLQTKLGDNGAVILAEAFRKKTGLQEFSTFRDNIGHIGMTALANAFKTNSNLLSFETDCNHMGPEGAIALASALRHNSTLQKLYIKKDSIGPVGISALSDALQVNKTLQVFKIYWSNVGDAGAVALANALKRDCPLIELGLEHENVGPDGAIALADALTKNERLQVLNISQNRIGQKGTLAIVNALKINSTLTKLDTVSNMNELDKSPGGKSMPYWKDDNLLRAVAEMMQHNCKLLEFRTYELYLVEKTIERELRINKIIDELYKIFIKRIIPTMAMVSERKRFMLSEDIDPLILQNFEKLKLRDVYFYEKRITQSSDILKSEKEISDRYKEYMSISNRYNIPNKLLLQLMEIYASANILSIPNYNIVSIARAEELGGEIASIESIRKLERHVAYEYTNIIKQLNETYPDNRIRIQNSMNYKDLETKLYEKYKNNILNSLIYVNTHKIQSFRKDNVNTPQRMTRKRKNVSVITQVLQKMKAIQNVKDDTTIKVKVNQQEKIYLVEDVKNNIIYQMLPETFIQKYFRYQLRYRSALPSSSVQDDQGSPKRKKAKTSRQSFSPKPMKTEK